MMTRAARLWLVCLCAPLWLASCGLLPSTPQLPGIPRTELVYVPVPAYQPLPRAWTDPIPEPPAPLFTCPDETGRAGLCVLDALATIPAYQAALAMCNADRARSALAGATDGQP